mmetsp:Transcript_16715/g.38618  ORF Transcript_16715/g.38618 Transcript_16715/m.38618 type:complete len:200 (+) Transcript_16715:118-717(+)
MRYWVSKPSHTHLGGADWHRIPGTLKVSSASNPCGWKCGSTRGWQQCSNSWTGRTVRSLLLDPSSIAHTMSQQVPHLASQVYALLHHVVDVTNEGSLLAITNNLSRVALQQSDLLSDRAYFGVHDLQGLRDLHQLEDVQLLVLQAKTLLSFEQLIALSLQLLHLKTQLVQFNVHLIAKTLHLSQLGSRLFPLSQRIDIP